MREGIGEHSQSSERRINGVEVFDLLVEVALLRRVQFERGWALKQNLQEKGQEIEVFLCGRLREGIDFEVRRMDSNLYITPPKQFGQTLEASAQIEDKGPGIVLLEVGDETIQQKR